jgi:SEC-C motif
MGWQGLMLPILECIAVEGPPRAPLCPEYPQFNQVSVPAGSDALSAWIGALRPFENDEAARDFLHAMEQRGDICISAGNIRSAAVHQKIHWADPLLIGMTSQCDVLVLVQPLPAHPRAYLLSPLFAEHYSYTHPHPRFDISIRWKNKNIPGLCVYSASEFRFQPAIDRNAQFLDQVTLYVGRHLIWLRTRQLYRGYPPNGVRIYTPRPGEDIFGDAPVLLQRPVGAEKPVLDYWWGYWVGPVAQAMNPLGHLKCIGVTQECWCGSGVPYGNCHRRGDQIHAAGLGHSPRS